MAAGDRAGNGAGSGPMRLVLASNNAKKLSELAALFGELPLQLVTQGSLGIPEAEEPHATFIENALAKARHAARACAGAAIADDSGVCVHALGGAPGVISAHYAGDVVAAGAEGAVGAAGVAGVAGAPGQPGPVADREAVRRLQDAANNARLLRELEALGPGADRRARFVCTLVAVRSSDDPEPLVAVGRWEGEILHAQQGAGGFGYDPLMFIPSMGRTVAELGAQEKNRVSHRAQAAAQMARLLREGWHLA
jgi:XTP/dITP diphosphohydrolase